jgi:outer membrane protein
MSGGRKIMVILGLFLLIGPSFLVAQRGRFGIHGGVGYVFPEEEVIGGGLVSSVGFDLKLRQGWRLSFDFALSRHHIDYDPQGLKEGTLTLTPFWCVLQYHFFPQGRFSPYLLAGVGYVFSRFQLQQLITIPEVSISQKLADGWGWLGGIGAEIKVSREKLSFFGEAVFMSRQTTGTTTINDLNFGVREETFRVNLDSWQIHLGLRYFY